MEIFDFDDDYLFKKTNHLMGMDIISMNIQEIIDCCELDIKCAKDVDILTAYRLRYLIAPDATFDVQIQEQLKGLRLASWSHDIQLQVLQGVSIDQPSIDMSNSILTQLREVNIAVENIRAEGNQYKTDNNLI